MHDRPMLTAGAGVSGLSLSRRRTRSRKPARALFTPAVRMTGITAPLRQQRFEGFGRESELYEVIAAIEARLAGIAHIRTREYDDNLDAIEAQAGPYALAFLYEIRRLERLLWRGLARTLDGARRTVLRSSRRRRLSAGGDA